VQGYLREKVGYALTGAPKAVVVRVYGAKREVLEQKAEEVRQALSGIDGLVDLRAGGQTFEPQIKLAVDLDAASRANVKPGDVRRASSNVFSGITVGYLFEEQKLYDVVVWGAPENRASLTDLENLLVERGDRRHVRLGDIAKATIVETPTVIRHDNIANYVDVVANVVGRDLGSVNTDIESQLQRVQFPLEVHPEVLGEYAERLDAQQRMLGVAGAVLVGIFLLMQACFQSWRHAVLPFVSVLAAFAGGTFATLLGGGVVTLGSIVGLLAALGIAARNSILLIDACQRLAREGQVPFGLELALQGAHETAIPILSSTLVTIAALLPFVALGGGPGLEIAQAAAIMIIGGLVASTLVTLFVLPALYLAVGQSRARHAELGLGTL
jgi:Cu/Ag efflux pump CusA